MSNLTDALAGLDPDIFADVDFDDGDRITDLMVIARLTNRRTGESFIMACDRNMGAITQLGLLAAANSCAPTFEEAE